MRQRMPRGEERAVGREKLRMRGESTKQMMVRRLRRWDGIQNTGRGTSLNQKGCALRCDKRTGGKGTALG